jgi:hypothetical protein
MLSRYRDTSGNGERGKKNKDEPGDARIPLEISMQKSWKKGRMEFFHTSLFSLYFPFHLQHLF